MKVGTGVRRAMAVVGCVVAAQSVAGAAEVGKAPQLTRPVHVSQGDLDPSRLYSVPALAVAPGDPRIMVAGFADLRNRRCGLMRSVDGGLTWARTQSSPGLTDYPYCSQSQGGVVQAPVAFGGKNTLYMALGGWDEQDGGSRTGGAVMVARSTDLGDTWQTTVAYTARGKTGDDAENVRPVQGLAVHAKGGHDDVVYLTFAISRTGPTGPNSEPGIPAVVISRDGGRNFGAPVNLAAGVFDDATRSQALSAVTTTVPAPNATTTTTTTPPPNSKAAQPNQEANFGAARSRNGIMPGVDKAGNVYVLWPSGTANVNPTPPSAVFLSKSTDGGATWTTSMAIPFRYDNPRGGPANSYAKFAVSREGVLHMVYGVNPTTVENYGEVFHQASTDGGRTWSERKSLTDSGIQGYAAQYFPNLSVAPNGRVDVAWWDVRNDPGVGANDVYYAYSNDDGRTWSPNIRISDRPVDRRYGVWGRNYDITSQPGVASTNAYALFGWDDTRANEQLDGATLDGPGAGVQDLYIAAAQFSAVGGGSSGAAKAVLAGFVGLVAVGLVLLVVAMAGRRGSPPAAASDEARSTATVG